MRFLFLVLASLYCSSTVMSEDRILRLYLDADRSNHQESAFSIEQGIQTALSEVGHLVQGYQVVLVPLDHRGNVLRSKRNYQRFLEDEQALLVYSGIHSPPLILNRSFINQNQALTLVPWAAGGPITRYAEGTNWVFRLSIDDMRAGITLVSYAVDSKACSAPHLLLESTPWGDSNRETMGRELARRGVSGVTIGRFGWNLRKNGADLLLRQAREEGATCILLVANAVEGAQIARAMAELPQKERIPIISHWGITGGNFHETVPATIREKIDLKFIQSCFSFMDGPLDDYPQTVFNNAQKLYPDQLKTTADIKAPVGFVHAYDLTRLLLQALNQVQLVTDMKVNRAAVRRALEELQNPVEGLIRTYDRPFSKFDLERNPNGHEAIGPESYCMASFDNDDSIRLK